MIYVGNIYAGLTPPSSVNIYNSNGTLTGFRTVDGGGHNLVFSSVTFSGGENYFSLQNNSNQIVLLSKSPANNSTNIQLDSDSFAAIFWQNGTNFRQTGFFAQGAGGCYIIDQSSTAGVGYIGDYHVNGLTVFGLRWIPDVGWVQNNTPTIVSKLKSPGQTGVSNAYLLYTTPVGEAQLCRVNIAIYRSSMVGTMTIVLSFVDTGGTPRTVTLATIGAGSPATGLPAEICFPGVTSNINLTITQSLPDNFDVYATVEYLGVQNP